MTRLQLIGLKSNEIKWVHEKLTIPFKFHYRRMRRETSLSSFKHLSLVFWGWVGGGSNRHCASNFHKRWCHFGQRTRSTEPLNFVPVAQMIIVINVLRSYLLDARNKNFTAWARWTLAATFSWMSHVDKDRFCSWGDRATGSWCDNDTDQ